MNKQFKENFEAGFRKGFKYGAGTLIAVAIIILLIKTLLG